jgi:hypothetical protein
MILKLFIEDPYDSCWFIDDKYLPVALKMVQGSLHLLSFSRGSIIPWHTLSTELRSAIALHFGSLTAVKFSAFQLPIFLVTKFTKLRSLSLLDIIFYGREDEQSSLDKLEALELDHRHLRLPVATRTFSQMQNLRLLSILITSWHSALSPVLEVICSSARSLDTVVWSYWMSKVHRMSVCHPLVMNLIMKYNSHHPYCVFQFREIFRLDNLP